MPLPPLDPSNTDRWYLDYDINGIQHTAIMRSVQNLTAAAAGGAIHDLLTILSPTMSLMGIVSFRHSVKGSNVTNVQPWPGTTTYGSGALPAEQSPKFISFIGRDSTGRRVRFTTFGTNFVLDANWRITIAENPVIDQAVDYLTSLPNTFLTVAEQRPVWKPYANIGYNAYWQRQRRTGS